jgi:polyisoprenyl-phosphate glycosyltransferase
LIKAKENADIVISLGADLQDDIDKFVEEYYKGNDIVYGVGSSRETDTLFKRTSALGFYKLMKLSGINITYNNADYRLMSKRAIEVLSEFKEVNLFLR